ncbi:MAG: signal recognition particle-docking protein FtsY [Candidatus Woesearchaeota archaeon]
MFKFLKEKIKQTVEKFSSKTEKEVIEVTDDDFKDEVEDKPEEDVVEPLIEDKENEVISEEKEEIFEDEVIPEVEEEPEQVVEEKKDSKTAEETIEEPEELISEEEVDDDTKKEESENLEEDVVPEDKPEEIVEEKKGFFSKLFSKKEKKEEVIPEVEEEAVEDEVIPEVEEEPEEVVEEKKDSKTAEETIEEFEEDVVPEDKDEVVEEKKEELVKAQKSLEEDVVDTTKKKQGFFSKLTEKIIKFKLTDDKFEEMFWEFELGLLESNVAVEVIEKIKEDLKTKLTKENSSKKQVEEIILETLKKTFNEILSVESFDLVEKIKNSKENRQNADGSNRPFVIAMIGVNGSGKTTTLAKLIKLFQDNDISMVVAASDTFRAAAIQQLENHTEKLGVKLIKHDYNADPAAVAFDAIKHAQAKNLDVVLIDTAGRLHSNNNLMDELKKVIRISKPDLKIFVGESITGNDCVEQATEFNNLIGIDGIILSKADVDENGGAAISVGYVTKKPILYLGTGQSYDSLVKFDKKMILEQLGF